MRGSSGRVSRGGLVGEEEEEEGAPALLALVMIVAAWPDCRRRVSRVDVASLSARINVVWEGQPGGSPVKKDINHLGCCEYKWAASRCPGPRTCSRAGIVEVEVTIADQDSGFWIQDPGLHRWAPVLRRGFPNFPPHWRLGMHFRGRGMQQAERHHLKFI